MDLTVLILLVVIALILFFIEFFVTPGITIAGIAGAIIMVGAIVFAFYNYSSTIGWITTGVSLVLFIVMTTLFLRAKTWDRLMLKTEITGKVDNPVLTSNLKVGDKGTTISRLAPMGKAKFETTVIEVTSTSSIIDSNTEIEVVNIIDSKILVKPIN